MPHSGLNESILRTKGWRFYEEKDPDKWENSAFIDPQGRWYNVPWTEHFMFAEYVIQDIRRLTDEQRRHLDLHSVSDDLVKEGWLLLASSLMDGIIVNGCTHMTMKQYRALRKHFGNMRLFRGWTIDLLWKEAQNPKTTA
jgi:hypothetical protein